MVNAKGWLETRSVKSSERWSRVTTEDLRLWLDTEGRDGNFKDCDGSENLPFLQANRLACHSFMDVDRRMRFPDERQRTLLLTAQQAE